MKVGIDSYCYHRYFGEIYPDQTRSRRALDVSGLRAPGRRAGGGRRVARVLFLREPRAGLPGARSRRRWTRRDWSACWPGDIPTAWRPAATRQAWREMNALIPKAQFMGADIMRIVASSLMFRNEPHGPQIDADRADAQESVKIAADNGVVLALENHIDYTSAEIQEILERVGSRCAEGQLRHRQHAADDGGSGGRRAAAGTVHRGHAHQGRGCLPPRAARGVVLLLVGARGHRADRHAGRGAGAEGKRIHGRAGRRVGPSQGQPGRRPAGRREYRLSEGPAGANWKVDTSAKGDRP